MKTYELVIRINAEVADEAANGSVADTIVARLPAGLGEPSRRIERYWKIPTQFQTVLTLPPAARPPTLAAVTDALGTLWSPGEDADEPSAVWNPKPGARFCDPSVRWASVELILTSEG